MTKRRSLILLLVLAAIVLFIARRPAKPTPPAAVAALGTVERAARNEAAKRLGQMPPPTAALHGVGKFTAELLHMTEDNFRSMAAVRGLITQEKERRALAQKLLAMPDGVDLMRNILLDPAFARDAFGTFQAEARFYAITVIDEAARQGNVGVAVNTAGDLAKQLLVVGGEPDRGRAEDLMGLTAVVGRSAGSQGLQDGRSPMVVELGLNAGMTTPVRALCLRGLFLGVWRAESLEAAQAMLDRLRTS